MVAGPDIMSVPALASYMHASLMDVFVDQMIWWALCLCCHTTGPQYFGLRAGWRHM